MNKAGHQQNSAMIPPNITRSATGANLMCHIRRRPATGINMLLQNSVTAPLGFGKKFLQAVAILVRNEGTKAPEIIGKKIH